MGSKKRVAGLVLSAVLGGWSLSQTKSAPAEQGSEACAGCHSEIYKSYSKTVMSNASGMAADGLITGEFVHRPSGVHYRVFERDGPSRAAPGPSGSLPGQARTHTKENPTPTAGMSYERAGESGFRGERELLYFIGSGVKGRTYLFSVDGFLFEAPINWYSQEKRWNMAPAYTEAKEIPMNLPSFVDCLNCHSSGVQAPVSGTESKFAGEPFLHAGITCQRCHGEGQGHGKEAKPSAAGNGSIVNPAKLPPERRDAICMECHFEGTVAVQQPGKQVYQFQPGEKLSDYIHYFLLSSNDPQKPEGLNQFEALSLSECKRKSGDKMWCGSCHDPHAEPAAGQKAAYYRGKCLTCHGQEFAAKHHVDKPDCTQCHMPALPSKDVAHTEATDHRIQRYPNAPPVPRLAVRGRPGAPLVSFPESDAAVATTRDFALAWESLAQRNFEGAPRRAEEYLRKAVKEREDDAALLADLAYVEQKHENENEARELYERALKIDPLENEAATNLGILEARAGNLRRAVELWQGAFARVPDRSAIGINLAMAFCVAGQKEEALKYVQRVLQFNPDYGKGKSMLAHLQRDPVECKP